MSHSCLIVWPHYCKLWFMTVFHGTAATYTQAGPDLEAVFSNTPFDIDTTRLSPHDVVVKTLASPINPSDVIQVKGLYPSPPTFQQLGTNPSEKVAVGGNEAVFEVVWSGTQSSYTVGDWVVPLLPSFGTWRTHAIASEDQSQPFVVVKPHDSDDLTLDQAATIYVNPCTALQLFEQFVTWQEGDWIVSNAGNSQVNKFLVQIAAHHGVNTVLVVRDGKPPSVKNELLALGASAVVSESEFLDEGFPSKLAALVGDGRVPLALNSVGGATTAQLVSSLSNEGTLVSYGLAGPDPTISYNGGIQLFKDITTKSYWLTRNTRKNPQSKIDSLKEVIRLYKTGALKNVDFNKVKYSGNAKTAVLQAINGPGKQVIIY